MRMLRKRLNPFEFRAGIYLKKSKQWRRSLRLNPFEFRAGIYLKDKKRLRGRLEVLIPLNSGLVFT